MSEFNVYGCQILTSKVGRRTKSVNIAFLIITKIIVQHIDNEALLNIATTAKHDVGTMSLVPCKVKKTTQI